MLYFDSYNYYALYSQFTVLTITYVLNDKKNVRTLYINKILLSIASKHRAAQRKTTKRAKNSNNLYFFRFKSQKKGFQHVLPCKCNK